MSEEVFLFKVNVIYDKEIKLINKLVNYFSKKIGD